MRMLVALGFAVAFGALTAALVAPGSAVKRLDDRALAALARRRTRGLDMTLGPLSMLATQEPLSVQALVALVMIAATLDRFAAGHFVAAAVGSGALNGIVKRLIARPRPAGPHLIPWFRGYSYPSGDALTATAIYWTTALIAAPHMPSDTARALLFATVASVIVLVAICRVYVGVHHPSDVVGGVLFGAAWAALVSAWFP